MQNIIKVAKLIWYDNGMINRFEKESDKILQLKSWLLSMNKDMVNGVDSELSNLSEYQLHQLACGFEDDVKGLVSNTTESIICRIFEEEYANKDIEALYEYLAHGGEEHREWLKKALTYFFNGGEAPEYKS